MTRAPPDRQPPSGGRVACQSSVDALTGAARTCDSRSVGDKEVAVVRRLLPVLVVLGVAVGLAATAAGETLTPDQQLAADQLDADLALPHYPFASSGGYSYTYT